MKAKKRANLGFIGAGAFIRNRHLLTARDSKIMNIHAVADLNVELLKDHASKFKIGYTTTNYKQILDDPGIDIVVIGTKQDIHAEMIIESLDAGKWVWCEKPMAGTEEETKLVLAAEKRNKGKLAIGFNRRFAPACVKAKELMRSVKRPWFINYRLMYPNPQKAHGFYANQPRILYEGCHILDLACWFFDDIPKRVFMTGDRLLNNCCILEFGDGSQVSFMCGSMGSICLWKEYMEIFSYYHAITISEFTDMRIRGFKGEFDKVYPPYLDERADEVCKYGFDFYETYKVEQWYKGDKIELPIEHVRRIGSSKFDQSDFNRLNNDTTQLDCDKGWAQALEHFVQCYLSGKNPETADGKAGALSTEIALALLRSLENGSPENIIVY